jgi:hypothetical protein
MLTPIPFAKLRKFLLEFSGDRSLDELRQLADRDVWRIGYHDMNVLWGDRTGNDLCIVLSAYPPYKLSRAESNIPREHRIPILRDPNYMCFEVIQTMR